MSKILSIEIHDEKRQGFSVLIRTDIGDIGWWYDDHQSCCEDFGITMSQPLSWLIGRKFISISLDDLTNHETEYYNEYSNRAILTLKLESEDIENLPQIDNLVKSKIREYLWDTWTIEFYNNHNGYYSHNLDVKIDGRTKWNLSL